MTHDAVKHIVEISPPIDVAGFAGLNQAVKQGCRTTASLTTGEQPVLTVMLSSVGMGIITVALFLLNRLGADTPCIYIALTLGAIGLGMGLFQSPNDRAIMSNIPRYRLGVASGTMATMSTLVRKRMLTFEFRKSLCQSEKVQRCGRCKYSHFRRITYSGT